jgi:glycosyltransferase involved in cell wall biosynthesis
MQIPRLLHQTWRDDQPPAEMAALAQTWREHHPGWQYRLWTDADCRALVEERGPWFLPTYDGYPEPIMRVDAFRYFLMFHVGGVYADLDFECLQPLDGLVRGARVLVGLEPQEHLAEEVVRSSGLSRVVANAFLASVPGHPFWLHVIETMAAARRRPGPLEATGPFLLTRALERWRGERVKVVPAAALYPVPKRQIWAGALDASARDRLRASGAFAVHHWMGTWVRHPPDEQEMAGEPTVTGLETDGPLVSALMVTRERPALAACAIECFRRQTWNRRELLILDDGPDDTLAEHVRGLDDPRIRILRLPPENQPLGALRNRAVAEAAGELVCQWDDDDLSHPARISAQMAALRAQDGDACVLGRETLWWPRGQRVAFSRARLWESSLLARRGSLPPYPELRRGEDTPVVESLSAAGRLAVLDEPRLMVYLIHGRNTFGGEHFETHWQAASARREGPAVQTWFEAHAGALPLERVRDALEAAPSDPTARASKTPHVLVLTPVKNGAPHLDRYLSLLRALDWPADRLSVGLLESDSTDGTGERLETLRPALEERCRSVTLSNEDFGFHPPGPRWAPEIQRQRRSILARSRNLLLERALRAEHEWVLWIDVDLASYPADLIHRLLAAGKDIVVPHVVSADTGDTFDLNTWVRDGTTHDDRHSRWLIDGILQPPRGVGRQYLGQRADQRLVEVDAVGGCVLLVCAALHRAGLRFPEQPIDGLVETEGLAVLARAMGSACYGLPQLRVVHS